MESERGGSRSGQANGPARGDLLVPTTTAGLRVGLLGGTFNPPHLGHLHVAETALERLGLDRLWVLVTPGNPLKERAGLPSRGVAPGSPGPSHRGTTPASGAG